MNEFTKNSMAHEKVKLFELFSVSDVVSIFYRGLPKSRTEEENEVSNDFWEFFYIDRGDISIEIENSTIHLSAGEGILYTPHSKHRLVGSLKDTVNVLSLSFCCSNLNTEYFSNRIFSLNSLEKIVLSKIINVGNLYFERYSNAPFEKKGIKIKDNMPDFAVPFIKASIEYFLLLLYSEIPLTNMEVKTTKLELSEPICKVIEYMYQNIYQKLFLDDFAYVANMSSSQFRMQFKKEVGQSVIDYFNSLKIEQSKILIRENLYSLDEIASMLNYCSSSHFSRQFKQKTNMSPTEYSKLVNYFTLPNNEV